MRLEINSYLSRVVPGGVNIGALKRCATAVMR